MFAMGNLELSLEYKHVPRSFAGWASEPRLIVPILQGFLSLHEIIESVKWFAFHMRFTNISMKISVLWNLIWKDQWLYAKSFQKTKLNNPSAHMSSRTTPGAKRRNCQHCFHLPSEGIQVFFCEITSGKKVSKNLTEIIGFLTGSFKGFLKRQ